MAIFVLPPHVAVMGTIALAVTAVVVMVNDADVAPEGIVTLAGTEATSGSPLVSVTTSPSAGAGPFNTTALREVVWPPVTVVGRSVSDASCGEFTARVAVLVTPR